MTDSHAVPALHNEAGWRKAHRCCCESRCQQLAEKARCLNCATMCFLCARGRVQEREPTGFNVPWHVLLGWGVALVDEVCGHVHPGALQEADDPCDN